MMEILRDNSDNRDFRELIRLLDGELYERYGNLQAAYEQYNNVEDLKTVVIGFVNHKPAGCGCFRVLDDDTVEIKRMYVRPGFRGSGIAMMILSELEKWAIEKGFSRSVLETGYKQPDAIRLYGKLGYRVIDKYDPYVDSESSICMGKLL